MTDVHDALRRFVRPSREERRAQRGLDVWLVIAGSYLLLAFAYLWPSTAPDVSLRMEWAAFLIRVLQFHIGLVVTLIAAYALARRKWVAAVAALPLIAFTLAPVAWTYVDGRQTNESSESTTRLMTANLLVSNDQHVAVAREIRKADPDVLVIQEYSDAWNTALQAALGDDLPHSSFETRDDSFGTALYSGTEPSDGTRPAPVVLGSDMTPQTRTVIEIGGREVALYNIHLLPPIAMDYVREGHRQFDDLVDLVQAERMPVIVVGDLNLTETTPQHAQLAKIGLRDAWDIRGRGRGATWPDNSFLRFLPGLRLDHVYVSPEIAVVDVRIGEVPGSDHRPVIADLALRE